jgi:hypothetical protein
VDVLLMAIGGCSINGYWCLLFVIISMAIILVPIGDYFIGGYWCLLMVIILMPIGGY